MGQDVSFLDLEVVESLSAQPSTDCPVLMRLGWGCTDLGIRSEGQCRGTQRP